MTLFRTSLFGAALVLLSACVTTGEQEAELEPPPLPLEYLAEIRGDRTNTLNAKFIENGIKALEAGKPDEASRNFNRALKFDPTNSGLHFLNGLSYHLMAKNGDTSQLDFAKVGYEQSLNFEPSNAWAAYQRGLIDFREQKFSEAQDRFAYAARYLPENKEILAALTAASYRAQDVETAAISVEKLLDAHPKDAKALRNAVLVYGAAGKFQRAGEVLKAYAEVDEGSAYRRSRLKARLNEWQRVYDEETQIAQSILGSDNETEGLSAPDSSSSSGGFGSDSSSSTDSTTTKKTPPKMMLADVVLIRTEERSSTSKGFNLLSGLTLQYSGTFISVSESNTNSANNAITTTRSQSLSIPAITYSINIFSDTNDFNEILARPTLTAIDGQLSEFFSGAVWHVELSASASDSSGSVTDVPIGIDLKLTPTFLDEETIQMNVTAARAFVEDRASEANFSNFSQTSKTTVTANVVMKMGQTLVLSGLNEKEVERVKTGVPILGDIPVVQYAFSNETTFDLNKSVLILITPRKAQFTEADGSPKITEKDETGEADKKDSENVAKLKARSDWAFTPARNLDAVVHHLREHRFFREFRSGDVALEEWDDIDSLRFKLLQTIEFLYF